MTVFGCRGSSFFALFQWLWFDPLLAAVGIVLERLMPRQCTDMSLQKCFLGSADSQ